MPTSCTRRPSTLCLLSPPPCDVDTAPHLAACLGAMVEAARRAWLPQHSALARALLGHLEPYCRRTCQPDMALECSLCVLRLLTEPGSVRDVRRQLAAVRPPLAGTRPRHHCPAWSSCCM